MSHAPHGVAKVSPKCSATCAWRHSLLSANRTIRSTRAVATTGFASGWLTSALLLRMVPVSRLLRLSREDQLFGLETIVSVTWLSIAGSVEDKKRDCSLSLSSVRELALTTNRRDLDVVEGRRGD